MKLMTFIEFQISGWDGRKVMIDLSEIVWIMNGKDFDKKNAIDTTIVKLKSNETFCIQMPYEGVKIRMLEVSRGEE